MLAAQLDDVRSRFGTKCTSMLRLQEMERDSTFQLQKMEWAQRAQEWVNFLKRILIDLMSFACKTGILCNSESGN